VLGDKKHSLLIYELGSGETGGLAPFTHADGHAAFHSEGNSSFRYRTVVVICSDAEIECLAHRLGRHYLGTMQKSASGKTCLPWIEGPNQLSVHLPDASTVEARNFCRYIPGQKWKRPSCLVASGSGYTTIEQCDVPYCGGNIQRNSYQPQ
jgi:hypothetical protein